MPLRIDVKKLEFVKVEQMERVHESHTKKNDILSEMVSNRLWAKCDV